MLFPLFITFGAFLMSLLGTRLLILAKRERKLPLNAPAPRKHLVIPTPRGGGIALVFTLTVFLLVNDASFMLIIGLLLLALVAFIDDWMTLEPVTHLVIQLLAMLLVLSQVDAPLWEGIPGWLNTMLLVLSWLLFVHIFRSMDNTDGLAAIETVSICAGLLLITTLSGTFSNFLSYESLIIGAAAAGFLWWNWYPARIALGSIGSIPLGFMLGYVLLLATKHGYAAAALILPAYYVADGIVTAIRQLLNKPAPHYVQQAVQGGRRPDRVARDVLGINILLIGLATFATLHPDTSWLYVSVAYGMVIAVMLFAFARPRKKAHA